MNNVLFILDYYLPNASANGICVSKVVQAFREKNINVSILCFQDEKRINTPSDNDEGRHEKIYDIPCPKARKHFRRGAYYLKWIFCKKHLPTENKKLSDEIFRLAEEIIIKDKIDTVVCTHLPIETIVAGRKLKSKYPSVNIVAYMLDSLSGGFLPRFLPNSFCKKKKILWENEALSHFDQVVLMESSREHHEMYSKNTEWYKKAHFLDVPALYNSFSDKKSEVSDEIVISFVGTMSAGVRTPYALLKALSYISDLKIRFIIAGKNACGDLQGYLKDTENILLDVKGEIPYEEAQSILYRSDFLVNLGNVNPNLVPSKIFEYMSCGKPIISTYTCDTDSSIPYLNKYPSVFLIDEREEDFAKISEKLKIFMSENKNTEVPYSSIEQYLYNNTPNALYTLLSSTCRGENEKI